MPLGTSMPASTSMESVWATSGCNQHGKARVRLFSPAKFEVAAVRCCAVDGKSCHSHEEGCHMHASYSQAREICSSHGLRLCTRDELLANVCCRTGCDLDHHLVWTADVALAPLVEQSATAATAHANASTADFAWVAPGCTGMKEHLRPKRVSIQTNTAAVRCCSNDGKICHTKDEGCHGHSSYVDSKAICSSHSLRLCTMQELRTDICCKTGCGFDHVLVWAADHSPEEPNLRSRLSHPHFERSASTHKKHSAHGLAIDSSGIWATPSCQQKANMIPRLLSPDNRDVSAVRCCDFDGRACHLGDVSCSGSALYMEARNACASKGFRLCTREELGNHLCCLADCNFDNLLVWTLGEELQTNADPFVEQSKATYTIHLFILLAVCYVSFGVIYRFKIRKVAS